MAVVESQSQPCTTEHYMTNVLFLKLGIVFNFLRDSCGKLSVVTLMYVFCLSGQET